MGIQNWAQRHVEVLTPYNFGARGDGITDDVGALNALFAAAAARKKTAVIAGGTFACIASSPIVPSGVVVRGGGGIIWQKTISTATGTDPGTGEFSALHLDVETSDVTIDGVILRGPYWPADEVTTAVVAEGGTGYSNSFAVTGANGVEGTATASAGVITSITITDGGTGHDGLGDAVSLDLSAGGGSGGRAYAVFQDGSWRSIGIAIKGRYDQFLYSGNWPSNPASLVGDLSRNIKIINCDIEGFGQSGIHADHIDGFQAIGNRIYRCGRDGIRMLGVTNFVVNNNRITQMAPGHAGQGTAPNLNVYGITATRVYNSTAGDGTITDYPASAHGVIANNVVKDCWSWKSLDTHGGHDIIFTNNECSNSYVGIGVDKGGFDTDDGYSPPRRIKLIGNHVSHDGTSGCGAKAGLFVVANDFTDENVGEDIEVIGNSIKGYGINAVSGGIWIGNYRRATITGNIINNSKYTGILATPRLEEFIVSGNIIAETTKVSTVCNGITFIGTKFKGIISSGVFVQNVVADAMTAISLGAQDSGYYIKVGTDLTFEGTVTKFSSSGNYLATDSPYGLRTIAWGNVTNNGTTATITGRGGMTVSRETTGVVRCTLPAAVASTSSICVTATPRSSSSRTIAVNMVSTTVFDVYTFTDSGSASDTWFFVEVKGY